MQEGNETHLCKCNFSQAVGTSASQNLLSTIVKLYWEKSGASGRPKWFLSNNNKVHGMGKQREHYGETGEFKELVVLLSDNTDKTFW